MDKKKKRQHFKTWSEVYWNYILGMFVLSSVTFESEILDVMLYWADLHFHR